MGVQDLFRAESKAFEDALPWMAANTSQDNFQILISRIQEGKVRTTWVAPLDEIRAALTIVYSPGHAGISYNESPSY